MNIAILGASDKTERFSNVALKGLLKGGHKVFPINPALKKVEGISCYAGLEEVVEKIDAVTVYLSPEKSDLYRDAIVKLHPKYVILNPGAENPTLASSLRAKGIQVIEDCTITMLGEKRFPKD